MTDKETTKKSEKEAKPSEKKADKAAKTDKKGGKGKQSTKGKANSKNNNKTEKQSKFDAFKDKLTFLKKKKNDKKKNDGKPKKAKKVKKEEPKVPFIDHPSKPEKPSIYIHKVVKLDNKNNEFTYKQFQEIHELSKSHDVIESFHRIGMSLNNVNLHDIPKNDCDKVCFVIVNNYKKSSESLGVGPVNDAYLFSKIHRKLGYKIVFLINPDKLSFIKTLEYFLKNTMSALTIYYSGRDSSSRATRTSHGIQFNGQQIVFSSTEFGKLVGENSNGQARILIISDCGCGGSIFSMKAATKTENTHCSTMVAFSTDKKDLEPKERRESQGLFTYYFCKLIRQFPNCSPNEMTDIMNQSLERFGVSCKPLVSCDDLANQPMYPEANAIFNGPNSVPPQPPLKKPIEKPEAEPIPLPPTTEAIPNA